MNLRLFVSRALVCLTLVAVTACSTATPTQNFAATQAQVPTRVFVRPTAAETATPAPTATSLPTDTPPPTATASVTPSITPNPTPCNLAAFAGNVTLPDLTSVIPGRTYTKTWQLRNVGTCTWSSDYQVVYISGDQLGPNTSARLPGAIKPGSYVNVSISLVMPNPAKTTSYTSYFMLKSDSGEFFGIGQAGNAPFWAKVMIYKH